MRHPIQRAKEIMTRDVESVGSDSSAQEVARKMRALDFACVAVCRNGRLVGMLAERDLALRVVAEGRDPAATKAGDIMNTDVPAIRDEDDAGAATRIMEQRKAPWVFVVDGRGRLVGLISLGKIARSRGEHAAGRIVQRIVRRRRRAAQGKR